MWQNEKIVYCKVLLLPKKNTIAEEEGETRGSCQINSKIYNKTGPKLNLILKPKTQTKPGPLI